MPSFIDLRPGAYSLAMALLLAGAAAVAQPTSPQAAPSANAPAAELEQENNPQRLLGVFFEARKTDDFALMERAATRLVRIRPQVGTYGYLLAKAFALQDKKSEAYNTLLMLNNQGLSFDLAADEELELIRGTEVYDFLADGFGKNALAKGEVSKTLTLASSGLLIDGMAWDPKKRELLVGSIIEGAVYRVGEDGKLTPLVTATEENGLLGVFDIAVDAGSRSLWVASAAVPHYGKIRFQDAGYSGVFQFDLDSGEIKRRFDLPNRDPGNKLVNLTVASDGKVYAANAARPEVYQIDVEKEQMSRVFSAPGFTSLRGLAVSPDAGTLYFSDYELGLFGVNLTSRQAFQVQTTMQNNLGGIDSLTWYRDGLIAIQNGNFPHRTVRIALNKEGNGVSMAVPVLVNHPSFLVPSEGIVVGDTYYLIANGNSPLYDNNTGKAIRPELIKPQTVLTVDANVDMSPGNMPKTL